MKTKKGFTLIELLVVITILGAVLSLVAPLGFQQIARSEAYSERLKFEDFIKEAKNYAFTHSSELVIELNGKSVSMYAVRYETSKDYQFKHLFFERQTVLINYHGFADREEIPAYVNGRALDIEI